MAESSSDRTSFLLPGLESNFPMSQEIAGRVRDYIRCVDERKNLKTDVIDVGTGNLVSLHVLKKNAEDAGDLQKRDRYQIHIDDQESVLIRAYSRVGWIEQYLRIEMKRLYHWVLESDLVKKFPPQYAIQCTSIDQINAAYFLTTKVAIDWPRDRVFRIGVGSNTTDGSSVKLLKDYAKVLNFQVVSLFGGMQFASGATC